MPPPGLGSSLKLEAQFYSLILCAVHGFFVDGPGLQPKAGFITLVFFCARGTSFCFVLLFSGKFKMCNAIYTDALV